MVRGLLYGSPYRGKSGHLKRMIVGNTHPEKSEDKSHRDEPVQSGVKRGNLYQVQD